MQQGERTLRTGGVLLARYRKDGSLEEAFGAGGIVLHDFRAGSAVCGPLVHVE